MELVAHIAVALIVVLAVASVVTGIVRLVADAIQQVRTQRFLEDYSS